MLSNGSEGAMLLFWSTTVQQVFREFYMDLRGRWVSFRVEDVVCPMNVRDFRRVQGKSCYCISGATRVCRLMGANGCCFLDHPEHFKGDLLVSALRTCFRKGGRLFRNLTVRTLRGR